MTHVCNSCDESFETLTRKRLHQKDDCPGLKEHIDTEGMDQEELVDRTVEGLLKCQRCEQKHQGDLDQQGDVTEAGYSIQANFTCEYCGFWNENTAIMEGSR